MNFKRKSSSLILQKHLDFIDFREKHLALLKSLLIKIKDPELTEKYFQNAFEEKDYSCNSSLDKLLEELENNTDYQVLLPIAFNIPITLYLDIINGKEKKYDFVLNKNHNVEWHLLLHYIQYHSKITLFNNDFKIRLHISPAAKSKELIIESENELHNVFFFFRKKIFQNGYDYSF